MHELVFLVAGLLILAAAIAVVLVQRRPAENVQAAIRAGLLEPEEPLTPPADLRPGTAVALTSGEVSVRSIRLTLLDLAVRGYLMITPASTSSGRPTWQLQRTAKQADGALLDYERLLVDGSPSDGHVMLSDLTKDPAKPLEKAQTALRAQIDQQHWFVTDARARHSRWGWIGALVLVLGLLGTASMLIDWVATDDFRGVIGGLAVVAAGISLASLGRIRSQHTPDGMLARTRAEQLRSALQALRPEDIAVANAGAEFSRLLPWAIGFGTEDDLAKAVDQELRRAANWGRQTGLELNWFVTEPQEVQSNADAAQQLCTELAAVVNRKTNGREHAQRVSSHA